MDSLTVRAGDPSDQQQVEDLLRLMHKDTAIAPLNEDRARQTIARLLEQRTVVVAEVDGAIRGSVGIDLFPWWYSDQDYLSDVWFFVHPKFRRRGIASRLIDAAKMAADAVEKPLVLGVQTRKDPSKKLKPFNRKMTLFGGLFFYGIDHVRT